MSLYTKDNKHYMFISHVYRVREYSGCLQFLRMRNVTTGFDLTRPLTRFIKNNRMPSRNISTLISKQTDGNPS